MEKTKPKDGRGGARQGAGRKPLSGTPAKAVAFRIRADLAERLTVEPSKARLIERLLDEYYATKKV